MRKKERKLEKEEKQRKRGLKGHPPSKRKNVYVHCGGLDSLCLWVLLSHPQPSSVEAPVYCGCPAGTHGCDDSSRQDDEPPKRQLVRGAVACCRDKWVVVCTRVMRQLCSISNTPSVEPCESCGSAAPEEIPLLRCQRCCFCALRRDHLIKFVVDARRALSVISDRVLHGRVSCRNRARHVDASLKLWHVLEWASHAAQCSCTPRLHVETFVPV